MEKVVEIVLSLACCSPWGWKALDKTEQLNNNGWTALWMELLLSSHSVVLDSLQPRGLQHAGLPCPSPSSCSLLKLMSVESVIPSNHLILWHPLFLLPSIFPSIRVFTNEFFSLQKWDQKGISKTCKKSSRLWRKKYIFVYKIWFNRICKITYKIQETEI